MAIEREPTEWNVTTLREHMLALRAADAMAIAAALTAAEHAVAKAETAAEKRFEGLNELRKVVNDVVATLITRNECVTMIAALSDRVNVAIQSIERELHSTTARLDKSEGKGDGKTQSWLVLVAAVSMVVGLLGLWSGFHH